MRPSRDTPQKHIYIYITAYRTISQVFIASNCITYCFMQPTQVKQLFFSCSIRIKMLIVMLSSMPLIVQKGSRGFTCNTTSPYHNIANSENIDASSRNTNISKGHNNSHSVVRKPNKFVKTQMNFPMSS